MKKLLIIITLSLLTLDAFAQRRVSGVVVDVRNTPAVGVKITEVDAVAQRKLGGIVRNENNELTIGIRTIGLPTENFTFTDFDGKFELVTTRDTAKIITSWWGMRTERLKITSDTIITIILQDDGSVLGGDPIVIPATSIEESQRRGIRRFLNP